MAINPPPMSTATWQRDYADGSGPQLLVEVDANGQLWIRQHDDRINLDRDAGSWLYDVLLPALRLQEAKEAFAASQDIAK